MNTAQVLIGCASLAMAWSQSYFTSDYVAGTVPDLDGDGVGEYLVRGPKGQEVRSGRDDRRLDVAGCQEILASSARLPAESDAPTRRRFGVVPPDVSGDVAMIVPWGSGGPSSSQRLVRSSASESLLWVDLEPKRSVVAIETRSLERGDDPFEAWHVSDVWVDDLDRDGVDDVIFHFEFPSEASDVVAVCGRTGVRLWRLRLAGMDLTFDYSIPGEFAFVTPGDLDGDGVFDLVFAEVKHTLSGGTAVYAISAATGAVLWRQDDSGRLDETLGQTVVLVSDRDCDGFRDLVCAQGDPEGRLRSEILVLSSRTGQVLSRFRP